MSAKCAGTGMLALRVALESGAIGWFIGRQRFRLTDTVLTLAVVVAFVGDVHHVHHGWVLAACALILVSESAGWLAGRRVYTILRRFGNVR